MTEPEIADAPTGAGNHPDRPTLTKCLSGYYGGLLSQGTSPSLEAAPTGLPPELPKDGFLLALFLLHRSEERMAGRPLAPVREPGDRKSGLQEGPLPPTGHASPESSRFRLRSCSETRSRSARSSRPKSWKRSLSSISA
jgi:hypothetical protein